MATRGMDSVIQHLRRAALLQAGTGVTDGQLLESFVANQDSAAFEALVRRHGRMVQGVCLRVLRNRHDAEDAFQATFLVLAHKAARVIPREMVGNWLYGVAHTTALRAKAKAAKRLLRERQVANMRETNDAGAGQWDDLQVVLDEELTKLPDKYRLPVILCDLEGRSRREVARQLKIPEGTLSSRLTTARRTLAKRLSRRGLALSSATMAALLTQNASSAYVAPAVLAATVKAAALLTAGHAVATSVISVSVIALKEGVLKAMLISKLKSAALGVLMLGALGGSGLTIQRTGWAEEPALRGEILAQHETNSSKALQSLGNRDSQGNVRLDERYKKLVVDINTLFPDSHVELALRGGKLVVSGFAKDYNEAAQILRIARSNAPHVDPNAKTIGALPEKADFPPGPNAQLDSLAGRYVSNELLLGSEPWDRAARNLTLEEAIATALKNGAVASPKMDADATQSPPDNALQQRAKFKQQMHNLRLDVEVAYWNLYEANAVLNSCEEALRGTHKSWMYSYHYWMKDGKVDSSDLRQIRTLYEEFRGERANSLKAVLEAERNLRGMMGLSMDDGKRFVPVTAPSLARIELKWDDVLKEGLQKRPELELARENMLQRELALEREKLAPDSTPASLRTHRLQVAQALYVLKDQEDRVKRSLTQQYHGVNKWYRLVEDRRNERRAYADALTKKFNMIEAGKKSVDLDLLDVQRRVLLAATKEYQAIAEYNNSLARLEFARGTILRDDNLIFTREAWIPQRARAATNAVHLKTAHFEADCKSVNSAGSPRRIILEGDVHLTSTQGGQTIRIEGQRVVLSLRDGTYTVELTLERTPAPKDTPPPRPTRDGR